MLEFDKIGIMVTGFEQRLEQIANQGKITNGLLALLVLLQDNTKPTQTAQGIWNGNLSEQERVSCIALIRTAFNDPSRILADATQLPGQPPL